MLAFKNFMTFLNILDQIEMFYFTILSESNNQHIFSRLSTVMKKILIFIVQKDQKLSKKFQCPKLQPNVFQLSK